MFLPSVSFKRLPPWHIGLLESFSGTEQSANFVVYGLNQGDETKRASDS